METEKLLEITKKRNALSWAEQDELEKKVFETAKEDWEFIHDKLVAIYNKLKDKFGEETTDLSSLGGTAYHLCDLIEEARDL